MATIPLTTCRPVKSISGNSFQLEYYPEAASQTFKRGEAVYLASGKVTEIGSETPSLVLGIAADDASGTTDTLIGVWIANADTIFEANYSDGAGGTAAGAVTDVNIVGTRRAIDADTTRNRLYISSSQTSSYVTIMDLSEKDAATDTGGRVLFQFLQKFRQLDTTS